MKDSDKLRQQLTTEENDFKSLAIGRQLIRVERNEIFEKKMVAKITSDVRCKTRCASWQIHL
jgi:hypothetical protein